MIEMNLNRRQVLAGMAGTMIATSLPALSKPATAQDVAWEPLVVDGSGPPARWDHSLGADEESGALLMYGGRDASGAAFNDTWIYDTASSSWSPLEIESPAPRFGSATAIDSSKRRIYLFGGEDGSTFYNDTWRFDFKSMTWRLQDTGESLAPTPRYGLGGVLDGDSNLLISHGFTFEGRFDDTWTFDTRQKTWLDRSPAVETRPLRRCLHEMVTDLESNRVILFGGCSSGFGPCPQGDLWSYDLASGAWTNITPAAGPVARSNPALVWDGSNSRAILFGGLSDSGQLNDLWHGVFDGEAFVWSEMPAAGEAPAARSSHDMVVLGGSVYLFGGTGPGGFYNDLWRLTL